MAYLAASDITVTLNPEDIDRSPDGRIGMRTFPTVAWTNAAKFYTALGIPMPDKGKFGFHFAIKRAYIEQPANGFIYSFDRANHKLRIWQAPAQSALTLAANTQTGNVAVANHVGVAPTGNVAAPANHVGVAPTGNVAAPANHVDLAIGAPTVANHIDLAIAAPADHSHGLVIAANTETYDVAVGVHEANTTLCGNIANAVTIPGGNTANKGGIANGAVPAPANMANLVHSVGAPANMANLTHNAPAFTGDVPANFVHSAPAFTGDVPANLVHSATFTGDSHTHTVTGGGAVAEGALAEMDDGVAPGATTLYMEMVGR